jgi:hypothetical protein
MFWLVWPLKNATRRSATQPPRSLEVIMHRTTLFFACLALAGPSVAGQQSGRPIAMPSPPEASCTRTTIACGTSVTGSVDETDCKISPGSFADVYGLDVPEDMFVALLMSSSEMDSYLVFREERALQPLPVVMDYRMPVTVQAESGGGTNARVATAADKGLWVITARGKKRGSHGQYTLSVKCESLRCHQGPSNACVTDMRFQVEAEYVDAYGDSGSAGFGGGSGVTAAFRMRDNAIGAAISVPDHCAENGHFWVSGKMEVDYPVRITVTDTKTGIKKTYENKPDEPSEPIEDREAFPCQ